jgi:hypothetical protein
VQSTSALPDLFPVASTNAPNLFDSAINMTQGLSRSELRKLGVTMEKSSVHDELICEAPAEVLPANANRSF